MALGWHCWALLCCLLAKALRPEGTTRPLLFWACGYSGGSNHFYVSACLLLHLHWWTLWALSPVTLHNAPGKITWQRDSSRTTPACNEEITFSLEIGYLIVCETKVAAGQLGRTFYFNFRGSRVKAKLAWSYMQDYLDYQAAGREHYIHRQEMF